jgi:hypothetical protein
MAADLVLGEIVAGAVPIRAFEVDGMSIVFALEGGYKVGELHSAGFLGVEPCLFDLPNET